MIEHKIEKLERPQRVAELNALDTLRRVKKDDDKVYCDIGAGSGIFVLPAASAKLFDTVKAVEVSAPLIEHLKNEKNSRGLNLLEVIQSDGLSYDITDETVDLMSMVTVFHEIDHQIRLVEELYRMLKSSGRLLVIEFHKKETPMGPPIDHRIGASEVADIFTKNKFKLKDEFILSDNFYAQIFEKA